MVLDLIALARGEREAELACPLPPYFCVRQLDSDRAKKLDLFEVARRMAIL